MLKYMLVAMALCVNAYAAETKPIVPLVAGLTITTALNEASTGDYESIKRLVGVLFIVHHFLLVVRVAV